MNKLISKVLRARLLSELQEYLQMNGQKMWRIRIPIYFQPNDPRRVVVVYPHAIDIPSILPSSIRSSLDSSAHDDALWRRGCNFSSSEVLKADYRSPELPIEECEPGIFIPGSGDQRYSFSAMSARERAD